jgi:hypothetical protein
MLRGTLTVVPGTAAFATVLSATLVPLGATLSFLAAGASMALVNAGISHWDDRRCRTSHQPRRGLLR